MTRAGKAKGSRGSGGADESGGVNSGSDEFPSMSPEWGHIGRAELIATLVIFISGKVFLSYPMLIAERVKSAGWLAATIGFVVAAAGLLVLVNLMNRFPDYSLSRVSVALTGRYIGATINIIFSFFFMAVAALILREASETLVLGILPRTPLSVLTATMVLVVAFGAFLGIEATTRTCYLLSPWMVLSFILIIAGVAKYFDLNRLYPLWGNGPANTIGFGIVRSSLYVEIVGLAFLYPAIRQKKHILGSAMVSLGISWVIIAGVAAATVATFAVTGASRTAFPIYYMARLIEFGRFLQRVEAIFVFLWFFTAALKVTVAFYLANVAISETLRLPNYRPLIPATAILLYTLAFMNPSYIATARYEGDVYRALAGVVGFGIPLVLWIIALISGKRASSETKGGNGGAKADAHA